MSEPVVFLSDEIAVIEETLELLRPHFPDARTPSWPFTEHHDLVSRRLRRRMGGRLPRGRMAVLLAEWARERGDMSLYVLQAFAVASGGVRTPDLEGPLSLLEAQRPSFPEFLAGRADVRS